MSSMKDIKQRIANIRSTGQIIKAMDMIASTKLHKARAQLEGVRPIYNELKRRVEEVGAHEEADNHAFYQERVVKSSLYVVLTSDRGFAGGFNANITLTALEHMEQGKNEKLIVVGSKGDRYFRKRNKNIIKKITDVSDAHMYYGTESIAKMLEDLYLTGEVDEVFVAYTQFENILSYVPYVERVLPVVTTAPDIKHSSFKIYEPDIHTYIDHIMPLYLHMCLFRAFSESHTSEQAARMVSMDVAGKNANEMIEKLSLMFNRRRQAAITQELSEIVGSASILNKNKGGIHDG